MSVAKANPSKSEKLADFRTEEPEKRLSAVDKKVMQMRATLKQNPFPFEKVERNG